MKREDLKVPDSEPSPIDVRSFSAFGLAIRAVLLNDWDPHNAARMPESACAAYDLYVAPLAELLAGGAGEEQVIDWLHEREKESMCFPSLGTGRLVRVARKLLAIGQTPPNSPAFPG